MAAPDSITVLTCAPNGMRTGIAAKTLGIDGNTKRPISIGRKFFAHICILNGLECLYVLLDDLMKDPKRFLIRGMLRSDLAPSLAHARNKDNFVEVEHHWAMLDCDKILAPPGMDPVSMEAIEWLISSQLPPEFHSASYIVQFSSSAGTTKAGQLIKAHLFFWLKHPTKSDDLRNWARAYPVDATVFNTVQPIYTANPQWAGGGIDPLPGRRLHFVEKQNHDVDLVISHGAAPSYHASMPLPLANRVFSERGLITHGREGELTRAVHQAAIELGWPNDPLMIANCAWEHFCKRCSLTDGKWTEVHALTKAKYIVKKHHDGRIGPRRADPDEKIVPHWVLKPQPIEEIRNELGEMLLEIALNRRPHSVSVLAAPPGIGKTQKIAEIINVTLNSNVMVEIYVPSIGLAHEVAAKFESGKAIVIKGRSQPIIQASDERMCARHEVVNDVIAAGLSAEKTICESCSVRSKCPYQKQFLVKVQVRIMAHNYITTARRRGEPTPDLIVIDEAFWPNLIEKRSFTFEELSRIDAPAALLEGIRKGNVLAELHKRWVSAEDIRDLAHLLGGQEQLSFAVDGAMPDAEIRERLKAFGRRARFAALFSRLANEMEAMKPHLKFHIDGKPVSRAVEMEIPPLRERSNVIWSERDRVFTSVMKRLTRLENAVPVICIDAQADPLIVQQVFRDRQVLFKRWDGIRNAEVFQIKTRTFSKMHFDNHPDLIGRIANFASDLESRTALFVQKSIRCQLTGEPSDQGTLPCPITFKDISVANFGQLVGRNDFESHDNAVVVGRTEMTAQDAEAYRGLWWADPTPLSLSGKYEYKERAYCHPSKTLAQVSVHPDRRIQAIVEQRREWETVQAIDRLRLFNDGQRKQVFIFTNLPLPIEVSELIDEDVLLRQRPKWELYAEQAGGVLIRKAHWLVKKLSHIFPNSKAAQNYLDREKWLNDSPSIESISNKIRGSLPSSPLTTEFRFVKSNTRRDRRPKPTRAIVLGDPLKGPQRIEAAVGENIATAASLFGGKVYISFRDDDHSITRRLIAENIQAKMAASGDSISPQLQ